MQRNWDWFGLSMLLLVLLRLLLTKLLRLWEELGLRLCLGLRLGLWSYRGIEVYLLARLLYVLLRLCNRSSELLLWLGLNVVSVLIELLKSVRLRGELLELVLGLSTVLGNGSRWSEVLDKVLMRLRRLLMILRLGSKRSCCWEGSLLKELLMLLVELISLMLTRMMLMVGLLLLLLLGLLMSNLMLWLRLCLRLRQNVSLRQSYDWLSNTFTFRF